MEVGATSGRREKTMVALLVFILAGDIVVFEIKKRLEDNVFSFKNLARE